MAFGGGVGGGLSFGDADLAVVVALEAMDKTRAGIRSAVANLDGYAKKTEQMGRKLTMALTLPIVGFGAGAVAAARSYERSFAQIEAFVGRSAAEVQAMKSATEDLAAASGVGPRELAEGFFAVTSAGFSGADAIKVMDAASKAAATGMGDTRSVAEGLTRAVAAYAREGLTAAEATDYLAATVQQGNFRAEQLVGVLGRVLPVASAVGVGLDDVGAGLAVLSRQMDIDEAATGLSGIFSKLIKPAEMAREELERVGLSIEHLRRAADEDLIGALRMVEQSGADIGKVFEDIRAIRAVLALVGADVAEVDSVNRALDESLGMVDTAFNKVADTADMKISQAMARMESQLVSVGEDLLPMVADGFVKIAEMVERAVGVWNNLDAVIQKMIIAFALLAAAAGPALIAFSSLIKAAAALKVAMMALSAHPVIGGLTLLAAAIGGAWLTHTIAVADATADLNAKIDDLKGRLEDETAAAYAAALGFEELAAQIEGVNEAADLGQSNLSKFWDWLKGDPDDLINKQIGDFWGWLTDTPELDEVADQLDRVNQSVDYGNYYVAKAEAIWANLTKIQEANTSQSWEQYRGHSMLAEAMMAAEAAARELAAEQLDMVDAFDASIAAIERQIKTLIIAMATQKGMSMGTVGVVEALHAQLEELYAIDDAASDYIASAREVEDATAAATRAADDQRTALQMLTDAYSGLESAMNSALAAHSAMTFASRGPLDAQMRFLDTLDALEQRLAGPVDEARRLRAELDKLTGERGQMDVDAAWRRMGPGPQFQAWMKDREERTDELRKKESKLAQEVENMTSLFDIQTKAGRENLAALLNTTDALAAYEAALIASGRSAEEAAQMLAPYRQQIIDLAADATEQFNSMSGVLHNALGEPVIIELSVEDARSRVSDLIDLYGTLPPVVATLLEAQTADALAAIDILQAAIDGVDQDSAPELTVAIAQGLAAVDQLQAKINSLRGNTVTNTVRTVHETVGKSMAWNTPEYADEARKAIESHEEGLRASRDAAMSETEWMKANHIVPRTDEAAEKAKEAYEKYLAEIEGTAARGGMVTKPTLLIAGEAGPEVLTPLDRIPQMNGMGGGGGDLHLTVNVGGSVIASTDLGETVATEVERVLSRTGNSLFS